MKAATLVNLGCGAVAHPDWVNLDLQPLLDYVIPADFLGPLPFADNSVDAVYHAHVLEHLSREDGRNFLKESVRVLRPGGVLRVVIPDLEDLCRFYVDSLDRIDRGEIDGEELREWAVLELIDQMVRPKSGGGVLEFLDRHRGSMNRALMGRLSVDMVQHVGTLPQTKDASLMARLQRSGIAGAKRVIGRKWRALREAGVMGTAKLLLGERGKQALQEATFRATGEVHRWMYDRISLKAALLEAGCASVTIEGAFSSAIADFTRYELDAAGSYGRKLVTG